MFIYTQYMYAHIYSLHFTHTHTFFSSTFLFFLNIFFHTHGFGLTELNQMCFLGGVYIKMLSKGYIWFLDN